LRGTVADGSKAETSKSSVNSDRAGAWLDVEPWSK
jgi:hypothetical protein